MTETDGKICRALGLEVSILSKWLCYSKQSIGLVCTCSVVSGSLWPQSLYGIFPGKNTGVGYHFLLQGIFQTQGSNPHILRLPSLLHWQADSSPLNPSVSMQSLLSYQWHFSGTVTKKFFFLFIEKYNRLWIVKAILRKKNRAGCIRLLDFKGHYKATVSKTISYWHWHTNGNIGQWNRIQNPEVNPCTYVQLICDKGGKNIQWRKDSLVNNWCLENCSCCVG